MTGALEGLRVVDFGQYLAAPLAAMILADHGAEVIRVDPPSGPRWPHHANSILQRGKSSIVLDLKHPDGHGVAHKLISNADVVFESFRPGVMDRLGLGAQAMTASNPRLVYCSIPGFGRDDPRAGLPGWEGVVSAAAAVYSKGGNKLLKASGQEAATPIFNPLPLASNYAAMIAVNGVLAALFSRERSGAGQYIEVPLFDAMFEGFGLFAQTLPPGTRNAVIHGAVDNVYRCSDGRWIYLSLPTQRLWSKFGRAFMPQAWFDFGLDDAARLAAEPTMAKEAVRRLAELFATRSAAHWETIGNAAQVPFTICQTTAEWLRDDQALASGAVIELDDPELGPTKQLGYAVRLSKTPPRPRHPRRPLNADDATIRNELAQAAVPVPTTHVPITSERKATSQALQGVRVVDLSHYLAGPTATRILAEYGAEILKVDAPDRAMIGVLQVNSGKRTALINLKHPKGRAVLWPHIEQADIFVQSFVRGAADRLGFGEDAVRACKPDIIYASESCYTYEGPRGGFHGVEGVAQTRTGMAMRWGDGVPKLQRFIVCDYAAGHLTAMSILLALYHRARTGEGQHAQAALVAAGTHQQLPFMLDYEGRVWNEPAGPNAKGWSAIDRLYEGCDGWFYLAAPREEDRQRLDHVTGLNGLAGLGGDALAEALTARFAVDTVDTWVDRLTARGIGAHKLEEFDDLLEHKLVRQRGLVVVRDHPGIGSVRATGTIPFLSLTPTHVSFPAPLPGADSRSIVTESGIAESYDDLRRAQVVADNPLPGTQVWL